MKKYLFLMSLLSLIACHSNEDVAKSTNKVNGAPLEMKPIRDHKTNQVVSYMPLPSDWELLPKNGNAPTIKGPNGIVGYSYPEEFYVEPNRLGMIPPNAKIRRSEPLQQIVQSQIMPSLQTRGRNLEYQYSIPEISHSSRNMLSQMTTSNTQIRGCETHAIESELPDGRKSLLLVSKVDITSYGYPSWFLVQRELLAPAKHFESAKKTLIYANIHAQPDAHYAAQHKSKLRQQDLAANQQLRSSARAHSQRMHSSNAAFQKTQQMWSESSNAISDMGMQSFRNNLNSTSYDQQRFNNMMYEENTVTDPWSGQDKQVQHGYDHYYANPDGEYIGTNDHFFNPEYTPGFDDSHWRAVDPN